MSSTSRWGDSGRLASTLLSLVRPQSTPAKDKSSAAEPETPESSSRKKRKRKHRKHRDSDRDRDQDHYLDTDPDQNQEQDNDQDDAMTTASPELPPLRHDHADDEGEADFGALPMFDSNATPASSQPADASASKKSRRDKKKDKHNLPSTKSQRRAQRHSSSLNGHEDGGDAPATPSSPSKKKRKNSDASDGKERKKRKSHAIDSIPEENGDNAELNGADADDIVRDVEAVAREAWAEHINKHAAQQQQYDTEMADAAPAEEAPADEPAEAPAGEVPSTPKRARSTRKKAKPTYFEAPVAEETLNTFAEMPSPSAMSPNPRRAKRAAPKKGPRRQRKLDRDLGYGADYAGKTYTQGKFSDDELARIAHAIEGFRVEHDMVQRDVNEMIQAPGGTSAGEAHAQLWMRVFAECPDRHRQKVINITRKKFHNFVARGTWTMEQDNELAGFINTHGQKWSLIAGIINRHPEDIRDRYRNYLVCGGSQKKEAWDQDEEARLTSFIQRAMGQIDDMRREDPSHDGLRKTYEELIDWQDISGQMGRTRSRLQCITKWKSMNLRINPKDKLVSADPDSTISFRLEKARRQLEDMPDEEKYRLVIAIQGSMAGSLAKIPWQKLCSKQYRNQWHRSTQELVWHRLMKSVPGSDMRTVRDCAQYLMDKYSQDGELPTIGGVGWDDDDEMALISQVPFGNKEKPSVSSEKLTEGDMEGDEQGDEAEEDEPHEMQIDPALSEVPQSSKKATAARRTLNGKRPSARKPKKQAEQMEEDVEDAAEEDVEADAGHDDEIDESRKGKRRTASKTKKAKASRAIPEPSSDMDDMEDVPARVAA